MNETSSAPESTPDLGHRAEQLDADVRALGDRAHRYANEVLADAKRLGSDGLQLARDYVWQSAEQTKRRALSFVPGFQPKAEAEG